MSDQVCVSLVFRMDNNNAACTNHFRPRGRNDEVGSIFAGPADIDQFGFAGQPFNLCIGDGGPFNGVVDVGAQIFNDVPFLEQFNKDRLGDAPIIGGIGEVFSVKITREPNPACRIPHGLSKGFNGRFTQLEKFLTVIGFHFPFGVLFHGEFNIDAVSIHSPREVDLFPKQALTPRQHINHGVLSNSTDVPCPGRIGWRCVNNEHFFAAMGLEGIASVVFLLIAIVRLLNGLLQINGPSLFW